METLGETLAAIESLLRHPRRSSSLVESFNARVRVLQMSRRNVSDRLLGLAALQWNVEKREEGPRRGTSPYGLLGVLEEADERRWWEVLLDAQEEKARRPPSAQRNLLTISCGLLERYWPCCLLLPRPLASSAACWRTSLACAQTLLPSLVQGELSSPLDVLAAGG